MTTPPEPVAQARCGAGHDHLTKAALYLLTDGRCYRCTQPFALAQTEVEHLIPQTTAADKLAALTHRMPALRDLDLERARQSGPGLRSAQPAHGRRRRPRDRPGPDDRSRSPHSERRM